MKEGQIYMPERKLRREIIQLHYDMPVEEHGGRWKTTELLTRNYWQQGVTKEVGKYIDGYNTCQHYKNRSEALVGKLIPNAILEKLQSYISIDFITKLSLAQGYDAILIVCNCFSKIAYFITTIEKTSAERFTRLFKNYI